MQREALTVQFEPTVADSYEGLTNVAKIVGVSDDHDAVERASRDGAARVRRPRLRVTLAALLPRRHAPGGEQGSGRQAPVGEVRHPDEQIATIGDMPNDVLMFAHSGLSIAMGQSDREVQRAARRVTASNEDDGFAEAVDRFILGVQ